MKRYVFSAILCLVTAAFILAGCGDKNVVVSNPAQKEAKTSITFFGNKNEPENVKVIEEILTSFMEENKNIQLSYESLKGSEYFEALKKRMAAGKGNDIFMVNHDAALELKEKGQLLDLSQISTISTYTDSMMSQMNENGKIYWLPTTVSAFGLYCNLDLLKERGMEVPANLKEWENICEAFKKDGILPIVANNDISAKTLAIAKGFDTIYQENRQIEVIDSINKDKELLSAYLKPGFTLVKEFVDKGYIDAEKALKTEKTSDDLEEFLKGESPFMLTGAWAAGRFKEMEPAFDFEVVPYPVRNDGAVLVINADTRLSVNAESGSKDAALKFVEFFTQKDNIQKFADNQSSFSPLKGGEPSSTKEIQPLVDSYLSDRAVIGADSLLRLPIWELTAEASQQLLEGESVEAIMSWIDEQQRMEK